MEMEHLRNTCERAHHTEDEYDKKKSKHFLYEHSSGLIHLNQYVHSIGSRGPRQMDFLVDIKEEFTSKHSKTPSFSMRSVYIFDTIMYCNYSSYISTKISACVVITIHVQYQQFKCIKYIYLYPIFLIIISQLLASITV